MSKRQFRGTSKPPKFYDRDVRPQGNTLSLSVGKVIPSTWRRVRLQVIKREKNIRTVRITKLLDDEMLARITATNQNSERNT